MRSRALPRGRQTNMSEPVIECKQVVKTYSDGSRELHILRGVDLAVQEGEILAITGASGVGKSTLLHIIGTLDRPTQGVVEFRGRPILRMGPAAVNRIRNEQIGFVFQFYHLLPEFTALENVMMPGLCRGRKVRNCRDRAVELLEKVGLAERMTHKPGMLSGGEQQRVAIARALYNEPAVVLADEPTGNLDPETAADVFAMLLKLARGAGLALLIATHNTELAARMDRTVRLQNGVLVAV